MSGVYSVTFSNIAMFLTEINACKYTVYVYERKDNIWENVKKLCVSLIVKE